MEQPNFVDTRWKKRILGTLWLTYALMYFGRLNMSIAMAFIEEQLGFTTTTIGMISGIFFWIYAFGQLINGVLGDHLSPRRFVFVGLLGTALMNLFFGFSTSFALMIILWGCNGFFQSTGWGPILKVASNWTVPAERNRVSTFISTSSVFGSVFVLYVLGKILDITGRWELVFWIPAIFLFLQALIWFTVIRDHPSELVEPANQELHLKDDAAPAFLVHLKNSIRFLRQPMFLRLALTTVILGMLKDGITLWTPMLLMQIFDQSIGSATTYSLVIPLFGFFGVMLASWFGNRFHSNDELVVFILFALGMGIALGIGLGVNLDSILLFSLGIGLCTCVTNAVGVILVTSLPLRFASTGNTSALAGFLDFAVYVGSGLMTLITGFLVNAGGWDRLFWIWVILFGVGAAFMLLHYILIQRSSLEGVSG